MSRRTTFNPLARAARSIPVTAAGAVLFLGLLAAPASAEEEIVIRPETVFSGDPGSVKTVAVMTVSPDLVGQPCDLRLTTKNQSSVHPGTSAIVHTGTATIEVLGVEDSPDGSVLATERVALGDQIVVDVKLGSDGVSSMGFTIGFECSPESLVPVVQPARQTATTVPSTTAPPTTAPPTTVAPSTTAAPGPPTTVVSVPTVLPARQEAPVLPQAAPARATTGNPNFTG